jgi:CubicO group peptidase (beta-lactamase class C family)
MAIRNRSSSAQRAIRADPERSAKMDEQVASRIGAKDPGLALAIVKAGTVVHAAGYGLADWRGKQRITRNTIFHLASVGKQFTGLGLMMLAEEGKLQFNDAVGKHLPELAGFGPKLTLRHLLHHTSGILDLYDKANIRELLKRSRRPTSADLVRTYQELGCPMATRRRKPGDKYVYSNAGYDLLGAVIERLSGQPFRDFFRNRVFEPLGMKDSFSVPDRRVRDRRCATGCALDERGSFVEQEGTDLDDTVGSGSIYSTTTDLCIYDRALAANELVSATSMREALTSGRTKNGKRTKYGFGWAVGTYKGMRFAAHEGEWIGYFSYACRYLDDPLSIFVLSNNPRVKPIDIVDMATAIYR